MPFRSVISNLNQSYSSTAASKTRNTTILSAVAQSAKFNLRLRFSLLNMIGSLTRSETLATAAQNRVWEKSMGMGKKEMKEAQQEQQQLYEEEASFKSGVVNSISTLTRQMNLLQSVTEKNSAMINTLVNDLGYFRNQRRVNFLNGRNVNLRSSRIPLSSKTVKGKIEEINKALEQLKVTTKPSGRYKKSFFEDFKDELEELRKEKKRAKKKKDDTTILGDLTKVAVAGGIAAYLSHLTAQRLTGSGAAQNALTSIGTMLGLASTPAAYRLLGSLLEKTTPVLGKFLKFSVIASAAPKAAEILSGAAERSVGRLTGNRAEELQKKYTNKEKPGTPEYEKRDLEIQLDKAKDTLLRFADPLLLAGAAYGGMRILGKIAPIAKAGAETLRNRRRDKILSERKTYSTRMDDRQEWIKSQTASDDADFERRLNQTRGRRNKEALAARYESMRAARESQLAAEYNANQRRVRGVRGVVRKGLPGIIQNARTSMRLRVGSKNWLRLRRITDFVNKSKFTSWFRKIPVAAIPYVVGELSYMASVQEEYDINKSQPGAYKEYKEAMTGSLSRLVNTAGAGAIGMMIGGALGSVVPVGGTIAGGILGFTGGIAISSALSFLGTDFAIAEKLFSMIFEDDKLPVDASKKPMAKAGAVATPKAAAGPKYAQAGTSFKAVKFEDVQANIMRAEGTLDQSDPYNVVYGYGQYGAPDQPLTEMTIGQILDYQDQLIAATAGTVEAGSLGTGAVGAYQFTKGTLTDIASKEFGAGYKNIKFSAENQDKLAKKLFDDRKSSNQRLSATWAYFSNLDLTGGAILRAQRGEGNPLMANVLAGDMAEDISGAAKLEKSLFDFLTKKNEEAIAKETENKNNQLEEVVLASTKMLANAVAKNKADIEAKLTSTNALIKSQEESKNLQQKPYVDDTYDFGFTKTKLAAS